MESLKKKLQAGKLTIGSWITMGHHSIPEIMAQAGFEWLTVDMEHSAIDFDEAQKLIQVIDLCGTAPLVRVGENDPVLIKRVMDAGSYGVIVPMVNSRDDALKAVAAVKYPPAGTRGVGLARAQGYGYSFEEYRKWVDEESIVIVQIEHIKAVDNLEDILSVEGIDAFIVGPYDLSGSLGIPGKFEDDRFVQALSEIGRVSKQYRVCRGYHVVEPDPSQVHARIQEGYNLIAYGVDFLFLGNGCRSGLAEIRNSQRN